MDDLIPLETAIEILEMVDANGLIAIPRDGRVGFRRRDPSISVPDSDAQIIVRAVTGHQEDVWALADKDQVRHLLQRTQKRMAVANSWISLHMDLWDRLERVYRSQNQSDTQCINGEIGCPDDAVVSCKACSYTRNGRESDS